MLDSEIQKEVTDKYSLRGRVFHHIREDILNGRYGQNEELREITVAEELGVSRTPVREALRQLELEGLVNIIPNKGAYVTGITEKDVRDIYKIRSLLEGLCARWATAFISREQLEEMEENVYLFEFHEKKGNSEQLYELDTRFHQILYEASQCKIMEHMLKDYHHYVQRVRKFTLSSRERAHNTNLEHADIVNAIKEKDADLAEKLANKHILNALDNLEKYELDEILKVNGK